MVAGAKSLPCGVTPCQCFKGPPQELSWKFLDWSPHPQGFAQEEDPLYLSPLIQQLRVLSYLMLSLAHGPER